MKNIADLGLLGLAPRLKYLSEQLYRQIDDVYINEKIQFNSRHLPLLQLLNENESLAVTELASMLSQTHPAISQMSKKLEQKGLIYHHIDKVDERRRLLGITPLGFELLDQISPVWKDIQIVIGRLITTSGGNILTNLDVMERQLSKQALTERMAILRKERIINSVEIINYKDQYAEEFYKLNRHWLEKYFYVEDIDHQILSEPRKFILDQGGFILMARIKNQIVGSAALIVAENEKLELSKMAIDEDFQGIGIGEKLINAVIQLYQATDFTELYLETNRQLVAALNLYDKVGFIEKTSPYEQPSYSRADVYMVYDES